MHIYAFGSVCRGEISPTSDIDLLAAVVGRDTRFDPQLYSIYSYSRLKQIWEEGNPFAWHLHLEARLVFASDGKDFLRDLAGPSKYSKCLEDCQRFAELFATANASLHSALKTTVFDLSTAFLGIRNFASCFSLGMLEKPDFSRHAALRIGKYSIQIPPQVYAVLERSRILSTRGIGERISSSDVVLAVDGIKGVSSWMDNLMGVVEHHDRL